MLKHRRDFYVNSTFKSNKNSTSFHFCPIGHEIYNFVEPSFVIISVNLVALLTRKYMTNMVMPFSGTPPYEPLVNFVLVYHANPKIDTALSQLGSIVKMLNYIIYLLLCSWT